MNIIFASLGRLGLISSVAISLAMISNWGQYKGYWHNTIYKVQTVDINILTHTLPTKLSALILAGYEKEIQRTINSNYGLFGIVVTDCKTEVKECPEQQIIYSSDSQLSWKNQLKVIDLLAHPYNVLRDPPPLLSESDYSNPRSTERTTTGIINSGKVIGRVYYVRGIPPSFIADYSKWLFNPLSATGNHRYYLLTTGLYLLGGVASWIFIEALLYHKRSQQGRVQEELERLKLELQEKNQLIPKLIIQKEQALGEIRGLQAEKEESIQELKQDIVDYEKELVEKEEQQQEQVKTLAQLQKDLVQMQSLNTGAQGEIEKREKAIAQLQQQIELWEIEKQNKTQILEEMRQDLQATQQQKIEFQNQIQAQKQLIENLNQKLKETERESQLLEKKLARNPKVKELLSSLETARVESEQISKYSKEFEEYLLQENQDLENDKLKLKTENEQLKQDYELALNNIRDLEEELLQYTHNFSEPSENIDLSGIRLALVGGHENTRFAVLSKLKNRYGLQEYVQIDSSRRRYLNHGCLKAKLSNCDLIVLITGFMGHSLSDAVMSLKNSGALKGDVLKLTTQSNATSSVLREIVNYFMSKS
ncbi:hypothetical protein ACE1B6_19275 [Aerosakkonemataceae cyanobacterium BLCC-F154]|uniref:DUF2325 domain-containing protein n=1 Tax=Floridaenema fluviatile BLCC-F154 TaxID=3153640 RepID=A0ABV4YGS5_9CYAN